MMRWIAKLTGLFMATCQETTERCTDLTEGALSDEQRTRTLRHLRICPACKAYKAQTEVALKVLHDLPEPELGPAEKDALLRRFRQRQAP